MKSLSKRGLFTSASAILLGSSLGLSNAHAVSAATPFQPDQTGLSCKMTTACFTGTNLGSGAGIEGISSGSGSSRYNLGSVEAFLTPGGDTRGQYVSARDEAGASVEPQKRNVTYTFGTPSGSPYCDGVYLSQTGYVAVGYMLYSNCNLPDVNAGGFASKIKGLDNHTVWAITTTDPQSPGYTYVYLLDEGRREFEVWGESASGSGSQSFNYLNYGTLLVGYTSGRRGGISATQGRP